MNVYSTQPRSQFLLAHASLPIRLESLGPAHLPGEVIAGSDVTVSGPVHKWPTVILTTCTHYGIRCSYS